MTFSTRDEALALLAPVRDAIERLPVAGMNAFHAALGAYEQLAAAIASVPVVDAGAAAGTARHRQVSGLAPIGEEPNGE